MKDEATPRPRRIRVALIDCTGLIGDIIERTLVEQSDLDVVGRYESAEEPPSPDHPAREADLVVWNNADQDDIATWLGNVHCPPRVLATMGDGRAAALWELTPTRTPLGELSPSSLVEAIVGSSGGGRP